MLLLEAAKFSLTKELTVFAIFVGVVIAAVVIIDLMYGPNPPVETIDDDELEGFVILSKVEEYRNDFPDAG